MKTSPDSKQSKLNKYVLIMGSIFFLLPNLLYVYMGWFVRLRADDYCFSGTLREFGLLKGLSVFYNTLSNRFSAFLVWSFSDLFGDLAIRFFSMIAIILFSFSIFCLAKRILDFLKTTYPNFIAFFISQIITFFSLYLAPNIHQGVYWRAAMVHYFLPLPALICLLLFVLTNPEAKKNILLGATLILFASIFLAGLSESYAGLHGGAFALVFALWLFQTEKKNYRHLFVYSVAAIIGVLITLLIMIVSPGNTLKFTLEDQATDIFSVIVISLDSAYSFIYYSLRGLWLPVGILFLLGFLIGYGYLKEIIPLISKRKIILALILIPVVVFFLVFCISAPTAYGMMAYPEKRVLMLAMPVVLIGVFIFGFLLSLLMQHKLIKVRFLKTISITLTLILSLYPLTALRSLFDMVDIYRERAQLWDNQHEEILQQIDMGKKDLTVTALDSLSEMAEMREYDTFWVNLCVAQYYDVETISAIER